MDDIFWNQCLSQLKHSLSASDIANWILPLQAIRQQDQIRLYAPNPIVADEVQQRFITPISECVHSISGDTAITVLVLIGTVPQTNHQVSEPTIPFNASAEESGSGVLTDFSDTLDPNDTNNAVIPHNNRLDPRFTFASFVQGTSNEFAAAAALQVADNPGQEYNPLFIYGGVGLGKTHLMQCIGNAVLERKPKTRILYLNSERFVRDMVKALQHNKIDQFKRFYRSIDMLLIDDIQFLAGKERSQEEFFHTFNALTEQKHQIILTCDRYPLQVDGLEDRLKSRFGWGLTVAIDPPELETRMAILMNKAESENYPLKDDVAFFIAKRIRSNVRELEGALRRVIAAARFKGCGIDLDLAKDALKDLMALQDSRISMDNIQKTVAEYYKIRVADINSAKRSRAIARPRQIAMALSKALTSHSLPEIGRAFGGRDHTTVLHACRKVAELRESDPKVAEDYLNLSRLLEN